MDQNGQLVSSDNRRLMAAQNAGLDSVPVVKSKSDGHHSRISEDLGYRF